MASTVRPVALYSPTSRAWTVAQLCRDRRRPIPPGWIPPTVERLAVPRDRVFRPAEGLGELAHAGEVVIVVLPPVGAPDCTGVPRTDDPPRGPVEARVGAD